MEYQGNENKFEETFVETDLSDIDLDNVITDEEMQQAVAEFKQMEKEGMFEIEKSKSE